MLLPNKFVDVHSTSTDIPTSRRAATKVGMADTSLAGLNGDLGEILFVFCSRNITQGLQCLLTVGVSREMDIDVEFGS